MSLPRHTLRSSTAWSTCPMGCCQEPTVLPSRENTRSNHSGPSCLTQSQQARTSRLMLCKKLESTPPDHSTCKEVLDCSRDLLRMGLEREVAGIEEIDCGTGNIALERLSTGRQ